jgi:type IV fimbrial biogenesis protein FimT
MTFMKPARPTPSLHGHRVAGGFSLLELLVGMAILAMVMRFIIPSMSAWVQGNQVRNAAESLVNGLTLTRAEAVRRNTAVQLTLTSVAAGNTAPDWSISCVTASASCPGAGQAQTFIQQYSGTEGASNGAIAVTPAGSVFVFAGTGRLSPIPAGNTTIDITNGAAANCIKADGTGGPVRCLRLVLSPAGLVRLCDPGVAAGSASAC